MRLWAGGEEARDPAGAWQASGLAPAAASPDRCSRDDIEARRAPAKAVERAGLRSGVGGGVR